MPAFRNRGAGGRTGVFLSTTEADQDPAAAGALALPARSGRLRPLIVEAASSMALRRRAWPRPSLLFTATVLLPCLLVSAYLLLAADCYTSEASFVVRAGGPAPAISAVAGGTAMSAIAVAYIRSRDAAAALDAKIGLRGIFARPEADILSRFPAPFSGRSDEALHRHLQANITVEIDDASGIATLRTRAHRPEDARLLADALLSEAEALVNRLGERSAADASRFASEQVAESERRVAAVQARLAVFRHEEGVVDPAANSRMQLAVMSEIAAEAAALDIDIARLQGSAADSPRLASLAERRAAAGRELERQRRELAGSPSSLARKLSAFELLAAERELATTALAASYRALAAARSEAAARRLYLHRISEPNTADRPSHPRPFRLLSLVLGFGLAAWWILRSFAGPAARAKP